MDDDHDYGGWLTEDLKEHYDYLMKQRDRSELYSDRAELNNMMLTILSEIQSRERKNNSGNREI
jgi:hypothetical protein